MFSNLYSSEVSKNQIYSEKNATTIPILTSDNIIEKIIFNAIGLTESDSGCIFICNRSKNLLECRFPTNCHFSRQNNNRCSLQLDEANNLVLTVFNERQIIKIDNFQASKYSSCRRGKIDQVIRSQIAIPLTDGNSNNIGVLLLESSDKAHYSNLHIEILKMIIEFGSFTIQNSTEIQHKNQMIFKLGLLSEASDKLLSEFKDLTLDKKIDFFVEKIIRIVDAELCSLFLVENDNLVLKTEFSIEDTINIKKRKKETLILPIKSGVKTGQTGAIAYEKKVYNKYGEEHRNHAAIKNPSGTQFLPSKFNYSELAYPMLDDNGELLGLLIAYNKRDDFGRPFTDRGFSKEFDEPLMKILTSKLTISIKNSQLVNELERFKLIIENTPDPVVTTKMDGTMDYINPGAIQIFGDIKDKKVRDYYFSDEISTAEQKAYEVMQKLKEKGSVKDYETVFKGKNDEAVPVSATFSWLKDMDGKRIGTIGIVKDLRKTKALIEVGNKLLSLRDRDEILFKISEICLEFPNAIRAYAKIYDESTDRLMLCALKSKIRDEKFPTLSTKINIGITGYVFKTQKPYLSNDIDDEPATLACGLFKDVKSKIVAPINRIDEISGKISTFGVINVDSQEKNVFTVNDRYILSTLANQAAAAIENANLIEAKTKIITELSALKTVQERITTTRDIDQILDSLLDVTVDILGFDYATISKVEFSEGKIGTIRGRNVPDELLSSAWHSLDSNDIQSWVVNNKQEVKITGWDNRLDRSIYDRFNHQNLVRIYLPIISRDKVFGTLETGYQKDHRQFIAEEEIDILRKVVNLAGIGIDQTYLVKEQNKIVDQLKALNEANIHIQSSVSEEKVVKHIFDSLKQIGYSKGMLSLINETTNQIEGRYALGSNWRKIQNETRRDLNGNNILSIAIRERRPLISQNCFSDPRCEQSAIRKANIKSQYIIPLIANEKPIGTLQIDLSNLQGLVKGSEDILKRRLEILETFACQIAIAIRNLRDKQMISLLETTLTETAHEFRSPLHNILTQVGGLKSYLPEKYEGIKEIDDILKIISEEAHRARRQMENTLLFSDRSRGIIGYNFETGLIQDIIQLSVNSYRLRALERGISIIVRDNVKRLPPFKFDKYKIEQVISNLIDNAVKYSHFNRFIQIQGFDDGNNIHLDFWNKGHGIPESEFDNIFQGFTRGSSKDKKRYIPGTGLGLKISKEIIDGHGGKIKVQSTPFFDDPRRIKDYEGYDTIFTIILPKKAQEKKAS